VHPYGPASRGRPVRLLEIQDCVCLAFLTTVRFVTSDIAETTADRGRFIPRSSTSQDHRSTCLMKGPISGTSVQHSWSAALIFFSAGKTSQNYGPFDNRDERSVRQPEWGNCQDESGAEMICQRTDGCMPSFELVIWSFLWEDGDGPDGGARADLSKEAAS
jgi:hypothetical protein